PGCLVFLMGGTPRFPLAHSDQGRTPSPATLCLGQADGAEWRMGKKCVGGNTTRPPPMFMIEGVGGDDLKVVVGRMGKGAAPIAVSQCPYAFHIRSQSVVHLDEAAIIDCYAGDF